MYIVISKVKDRIKEINPSITQVSRSFMAELNRKVDVIMTEAARRNGGRKTITSAELMNGADFGVKKRRK